MLDASKLIFDGHDLNVLGLLNFEFVSLREEMIRIWNIRHEAQRHSGGGKPSTMESLSGLPVQRIDRKQSNL
jgi:hypothetical protein